MDTVSRFIVGTSQVSVLGEVSTTCGDMKGVSVLGFGVIRRIKRQLINQPQLTQSFFIQVIWIGDANPRYI